VNVTAPLPECRRPCAPIVARARARQIGRIEVLPLHLHDHPMQQAVAEDGVAGNFARHVRKKGATGFDIERHAAAHIADICSSDNAIGVIGIAAPSVTWSERCSLRAPFGGRFLFQAATAASACIGSGLNLETPAASMRRSSSISPGREP
jgi:hypothetical protein